MEIFQHSQRGVHFYGKFATYTADLQSKVADFVVARDMEKNNWVEYLDQQYGA